MDFVADQLFNGQRIRALTVVDNFSRESLAITVDFALKAEDVVTPMRHEHSSRGDRTPYEFRLAHLEAKDLYVSLLISWEEFNLPKGVYYLFRKLRIRAHER
jgi:putative transposase